MKVILKIFIYGSIIALIYYLFNIDYLSFKNIEFNYFYLSISVFLLFGGFVLSALSWRFALKLHGPIINFRKAIVSHGLPVFTKYIPGRIWTILGRAALIQNKDYNVKFLTFVSFKEQLIYLCLGFFISIYPILKTEKIREYSLIIIGLSLGLFLLLYSRMLQKWFENLWNRLFKMKIDIPKISLEEFLKLSLFIILYWLLWATGFYFLLISVFGILPFYNAFAFPLSISLGLIAIIFPGGIGVREGVLTLFLISNGVQAEQAIAFSILSRIWFLIGEIFMFFLALILKRKI
ncbi:MAG TPA: hypothetical protein DCG75_18805 [Bacteroidales bacterium]|nr:hypothetical protein [Bacteroidales bacterium]